MDDTTGETTVPTGVRRRRQGEAFWREMVMTWTASGLGAQQFCHEQGLAVSTFGLWRKKLSGESPAEAHRLVVTPKRTALVSTRGRHSQSNCLFTAAPG
jgi:hypothetical protein